MSGLKSARPKNSFSLGSAAEIVERRVVLVDLGDRQLGPVHRLDKRAPLAAAQAVFGLDHKAEGVVWLLHMRHEFDLGSGPDRNRALVEVPAIA